MNKIKNITLELILISMCFVISFAQAQPVEVIANYPYLENLADATGNNTDTFLEGNPTPPTVPSIGTELCQNGIYLLNPDGQSIQTPILNDFDLNNFELEIEFKPLASVPSTNPFGYSAVIMGGKFARWIGISINNQDRIGLKYNNSNTIFSTSSVTINDVYHTGRIRYENGSTQLYLNNNPTPIVNTTLPPLEPFLDDYEFTTTDYNTGRPFNGCIRNLIVSSTKQSIFNSGFE